MVGGVERVLCLGNLVIGRALRGDRGVHLLSPLIEQLDSSKTLGYEGLGALELLLGQGHLALLLHGVCLSLVERALREIRHRLGFLQRSLEVFCIHHRDDLASGHHVAFVNEKMRDTTRKLGVDVDLVGFQATFPPEMPGGSC